MRGAHTRLAEIGIGNQITGLTGEPSTALIVAALGAKYVGRSVYPALNLSDNDVSRSLGTGYTLLMPATKQHAQRPTVSC